MRRNIEDIFITEGTPQQQQHMQAQVAVGWPVATMSPTRTGAPTVSQRICATLVLHRFILSSANAGGCQSPEPPERSSAGPSPCRDLLRLWEICEFGFRAFSKTQIIIAWT